MYTDDKKAGTFSVMALIGVFYNGNIRKKNSSSRIVVISFSLLEYKFIIDKQNYMIKSIKSHQCNHSNNIELPSIRNVRANVGLY